MNIYLRRLWEDLRSSMGFIPALLTGAAVVAALGMVRLDHAIDPDTAGLGGLVFGGGPEGAQGVLSAIASSVATVAGVIFSVTIVSLTLASQQFTPRVLRQFTSDRGIQLVLGSFLGTFVYCLLVLRTIRASGFGEFVPHFAVTLGVLLAVLSLGMLIYFIHHVSVTIQVGHLIQRVAAETHEALDHLFPEPLGQDAEPTPSEPRLPALSEGRPLRPGNGYLQTVAMEGLLRTLQEHDLVLRLERRIGDFVPRGATAATAWPGGRVSPQVEQELQRCFSLGPNRTLAADPEFGVVQIEDIAVKALSPGINDPTTAITCLQHLTGLLLHLGGRRIPSPYRQDRQGALRVIAPGPDWERMLELAFDPVRHYGSGDARVMRALLHSLGELLREVTDPRRRAPLWEHVYRTEAAALRSLEDASEQEAVRKRVAELRRDELRRERIGSWSDAGVAGASGGPLRLVEGAQDV